MLLQILTVGIPFLIMTATDWLKHDALPERVNALIVIVVTFLLAGIWALFSGQLIGNFYADFLLIAALSFAIMGIPELAPIRAWLQSILTSPFAMLAPAASLHTPVTLRASRPTHDQALTQHNIVDAEISSQPTRPMPAPQTHDE